MVKKIGALAIITVMLFTMLAGCSSYEEKIVGVWKSQKTTLGVVTETVYTFNEDGTGTTSGLLGVDLDMTYVITDSTITITYASELLDIKTQSIFTYTLKKDTLVLTEGSESTTFTKQS